MTKMLDGYTVFEKYHAMKSPSHWWNSC